MMLSQKEILEIVRLIEDSRFEVCELRAGDFRLTLSNYPIETAASDLPAPEPRSEVQKEIVHPHSSELPADDVDPALHAVISPMVGVFYRAPEPGARPFVEVGSRVDEDTTVGLVEVMKVFNAVNAGVNGIVEVISSADQQLVEYGETVMLVRPDATGGP